MKILLTCLLCWMSLSASVPVQMSGKQFLVHQEHVYSRACGDRYFEMAKGIPVIPASHRFARTIESIWDGQSLLRYGKTTNGRHGLEVGQPVAREGAPGMRWTFSDPCWMPGPIHLLAAWNGTALVEVLPKVLPKTEVKKNMEVKDENPVDKELKFTKDITLPRKGMTREEIIEYVEQQLPIDYADMLVETIRKPISRSLSLVDLGSGEQKKLRELKFPSTNLFVTVVVDGKAYLLFGSGEVFAYSFLEEKLDSVTENLWKDLGYVLCKKMRGQENPEAFGPAFLDPFGAILLPVRPMLVLEKDDMERMWPKLPDRKKDALLRAGLYPFDASKGIGWKSQAGFIELDPVSMSLRRADINHYKNLIQEVDDGYIYVTFRDASPGDVFHSDGFHIQPLDEALKLGEQYRAEKAPQLAAKTPKSRFRVGSRDHGQEPRFSTDSGQDGKGHAYIKNGENIYLIPGEKPTVGFNTCPLPPKTPNATWESNDIKYRNGCFFVKNSKTVQKYDPQNGQWKPVLQLSYDFAQFDVNGKGQILIVQPGYSKLLKAYLPEEEKKVQGRIIRPFLEIWETNGTSPLKQIGFDTEEKALYQIIEGMPGFTHSWTIGEWTMIYNNYSGRLYGYNSETGKLDALQTPWKGLSLATIADWEKTFGKFYPSDVQVPIDMIDCPSDRLQFCPTPKGIFLLYNPKMLPKGWKEKALQRLNSEGPSAVPGASFGLPESDDPEKYQVVRSETNFKEKRFKIVDSRDWSSQKIIWVDEKGDLIDLEAFITNLKPTSDSTPIASGPISAPTGVTRGEKLRRSSV